MPVSKLNSPVLGGLLVAALALAALGWARAPQGNSPPVVPPPAQTQTFYPLTPASSTADSNHRMVAVTGVDITGASILYLVDTINYRLAVYQANGGSGSSQGLRLIGARRIDLDLQLDGLNDRSDYSYKDLRRLFSEQGLLPPGSEASAPALEPKHGGN
jgi:hypothetical protein